MANQAALEEDTQKLESELVAEPSAASDPAAKEPEGGSGVCYLVDDKVQEVQFYISQQMWQAARNALNELTEIAPESPQLPELMAAIAAGSTPEISQKPDEVSPEPAIEPDRTPVMEQAVAANFLPPPFAAPAPPTNSAFMDPFAARMPAATAASAVPAAKQTRVTGKSPADEESVLDLGDDLAAPTAQVPAPRASADSFAATQSTEDILTDFVHDLESTELKDFLPKPHAEPAITAPPVAAPAPAQATNGGVQSQEAGSVLADILSDLQEETAEPNESEEDPETHYNLGIAFKEMGLLDEAIGELQKVCRAVDKGQMFSQPIQAYTWLAQCLVDKGAPEAAVRWYQKALKIPALDDSSRCAIYYDLAAAYEAFGDTKSALANFMEVYGSNIDFRDVASRIRTLKS
jgi:tetratricopeptide (TPR) repeat protein